MHNHPIEYADMEAAEALLYKNSNPDSIFNTGIAVFVKKEVAHARNGLEWTNIVFCTLENETPFRQP
jgi:hypothetical protein